MTTSPMPKHEVVSFVAVRAAASGIVAFFTDTRTAVAQNADAQFRGQDRSTVALSPLRWENISPMRTVEVAPDHFLYDFGRVAFGRLEISFPQGEQSHRVKVHLGESLSGLTVINRHPGGSVRYYTTELALGSGPAWQPIALSQADARLMDSPEHAVMPFRYAEIDGAPPGFSSANVRQVAASYPCNDHAASFRCSNEKLNAIWALCQYTMKATSFGRVFIDGDRERKPYEADAYINQLGWYACTGDWLLPRHSGEYLIQHPTWPTEWIMFSVLMAWEDFLFTGDLTSARAFYADLKAKTLIDLERPDGLISTVYPLPPPSVGRAIHIAEIHDIVDWPMSERDGYDMRPVNTVVNAFHCRALSCMAKLALALGEKADAARFETAAARAVSALNEKLSDRATGLYVDGEGSAHSAIHANFFPLAFGLVPSERRRAIVDFLVHRGMRCSVYGAQFLLESLFQNGAADDALALMTAAGDRSWSHMIDDVGATLTLEAWDNRYKPNQDWNHAWGAAPANLIPRELMGIKPLEPGYDRIQIAPRPGRLRFAEIRIPSIHGPIGVRFENGDEFVLTVEIPNGTRAKIGLPAPGLTVNGSMEATVDGQAAQIEVVENSVTLAHDLGPGVHTIHWQRTPQERHP